MADDLTQRTCVPCQGGIPPLQPDKIDALHNQLQPGWDVVGAHHLSKTYKFEDFAGGLHFVNKVGQLAEEQGHHPDIYLSWGQVRVDIWTHKIDGLTESDFVLAAKTDALN